MANNSTGRTDSGRRTDFGEVHRDGAQERPERGDIHIATDERWDIVNSSEQLYHSNIDSETQSIADEGLRARDEEGIRQKIGNV